MESDFATADCFDRSASRQDGEELEGYGLSCCGVRVGAVGELEAAATPGS